MIQDLRFAVRSLRHAKGLFATVVVTLALGIGANAAIFSVVRGVLLRPLTNRDESRLLYVRQSAPGVNTENTTFSVPEIADLRGRVKSLAAIGEFSTIGFTMVGLGEPRQVRAGVVNGTYFEVMGLNAALGRLIEPGDDGPAAAGVAVLTHRFWNTELHADPAVLGKTIRLGSRSATVIGVLEPSVPYPAETELIANIVTSPHHLSATMVTGREHRMTEVFGRLEPGASLESALTEIRAVHRSMIAEHPEAYSSKAGFAINAVRLRDQITASARTILLLLMSAAALIFIIACSNVANLILARAVRREGELAVRAALGASAGRLRRTLLAESLVLCGTGAILGLLIAPPMVSVLARYASRYSVRALDLTLDASLLWIGFGLAIAAAVLLAYIPRLPERDARGATLATVGTRATGGAGRRMRAFAVTQIAASFVLLAGAGMLLLTLLSLQAQRPGFETVRVLAINVPVTSFQRTPAQIVGFYRDLRQRVSEMPGVERVAVGSFLPWRDASIAGQGLQFAAEGRARENGREDSRARIRAVSPDFFATLGIRLTAGREFSDGDRSDAEPVVLISQSVATQLFPNQDPLDRRVMWTDPITRFIGITTQPRRVVGVVPDVDDEHVAPQPAMTIYMPFDQAPVGGRLFVSTGRDPYSFVPAITSAVRAMSPDQVVERAATLEDVRSDILAPERLNALVFGGFAGVALAISAVGVAGVLAFSVSARTREFGIRLAIGSLPRALVTTVLAQGLAMATIGVGLGVAAGFGAAALARHYLGTVQMPGVAPISGAAGVLIAIAVLASVVPARRAARVDVIAALRSE